LLPESPCSRVPPTPRQEEAVVAAADFMVEVVERHTLAAAARHISAAVESRMGWAAARILAVVECALAVRPISAAHRVWVACTSAAHLTSAAGRRYRISRRILPSMHSLLLQRAVTELPITVPCRTPTEMLA
jgi:hypothetical protein